MKSNFDLFGRKDIVLVDSTFKTNQYNYPLVKFSGIDHCYRNMLFRVAIINQENAESYEWIFNSFFKLLEGKPYIFLSDQYPSIKSALKKIAPEIIHRNCSWHISQNFLRHFRYISAENSHIRDKITSLPYKKDRKIFENDVDVITKFLDEKGFDKALKYFEGVLVNKANSCPAFYSPIFDAEICSTSRVEAWNAHLKRYLFK